MLALDFDHMKMVLAAMIKAINPRRFNWSIWFHSRQVV
jgi:hypothetical protein